MTTTPDEPDRAESSQTSLSSQTQETTQTSDGADSDDPLLSRSWRPSRAALETGFKRGLDEMGFTALLLAPLAMATAPHSLRDRLAVIALLSVAFLAGVLQGLRAPSESTNGNA